MLEGWEKVWGVVCTAWCVPVYWLGPNLAGVRVMAAPHSCSSHRVGVAILSVTAGARAGTRAGAGAGRSQIWSQSWGRSCEVSWGALNVCVYCQLWEQLGLFG